MMSDTPLNFDSESKTRNFHAVHRMASIFTGPLESMISTAANIHH